MRTAPKRKPVDIPQACKNGGRVCGLPAQSRLSPLSSSCSRRSCSEAHRPLSARISSAERAAGAVGRYGVAPFARRNARWSTSDTESACRADGPRPEVWPCRSRSRGWAWDRSHFMDSSFRACSRCFAEAFTRSGTVGSACRTARGPRLEIADSQQAEIVHLHFLGRLALLVAPVIVTLTP